MITTAHTHGTPRVDAAALMDRRCGMTARDLQQAALDYVRGRVFAEPKAVFPLHPSCKRPMTVSGLHDASADPKQAQAWWTEQPEASLGRS